MLSFLSVLSVLGMFSAIKMNVTVFTVFAVTVFPLTVQVLTSRRSVVCWAIDGQPRLIKHSEHQKGPNPIRHPGPNSANHFPVAQLRVMLP